MSNINENHDKLIRLFEVWAGEKMVKFSQMPRSGSDRQYFRIQSASRSAVGVINHDKKENEAFLGFSEHFISSGLPVPRIFAQDIANNIYIQEDLGDMTLFNFLQIESEQEPFSSSLEDIYKKVLDYLPVFQIKAGNDLNYNLCYPRAKFDSQSMNWDLNYFKYYFLKLAAIPFDEQALEDDYQRFISYLMQADDDYFLYRDFQSRNVMIKDGEVYFIDYQGGRKGALHYDLASLLYDAKANIPQEKRESLLNYYLKKLGDYTPFDEKEFRGFFGGFVMIRIMQAMGAYGFRGFYEKKKHFLASIPYALDNMSYVLENYKLPIELPTLIPLLKKVTESERLRNIGKQTLTVSVNSFSFKRGIPIDETGHGGGHVFDCRALPNPGRLEEYRHLTGRDLRVIEFLKKEAEVDVFFNNCLAIADQSVKNYLQRGFKNLSINFGCTGGQHRSVYLAELMAKNLKNLYDVQVVLRHREQELNPAGK